ncbi:MAG TPA: MFS transporter [Streptomyces sp.]|uniref:CynX/NimT family MFS transporter n=1 Tax=Streptomyces sp. TaxID=1931 RepID=UPI002B636FE1|nr:MFS transporter [Streptomyces sp.]HWU06913.1 MFS transporter [Streptomyces sp.]
MTFSSRISRLTAVWIFIGLVLLALNLRAAITGVPPVLGELQDAFGLTGIEVSVLATLPELCVGTFSALAPLLARRFGITATITTALLVLTAGLLLRVIPAQAALFTGTALAGAGMATGNVLVPAVIKHVFPHRVGALTGLSMMLLSVGGAAAAGLAVPLEHTGGWRLALAIWAIPSLIAALVWLPLALRDRRKTPHPPTHQHTHPTTPTGARADTRAGARPREGTLLSSPLAWCVMIFMGMTSLMFYTLTSWLPEMMQDQGVSPSTAGTMNSLIIIIGIPLGFLVPVLTARLHDQRPLVLASVTLTATGLIGLLLAPQAGWLWTTVFGIATGSAFPIALTLLNLRSPDATTTARLSGMAQCGGYLLAATGPLTFGILHTLTHTWKPSITFLLLLVIPELLCGLHAARPGHVHPTPTPHTQPPTPTTTTTTTTHTD